MRAGFFRLFQRTLGWQRLAAIARRDGLPLPDAALLACFEALLALAGASASSDAAFVACRVPSTR
jgi:hypothetical protein